MLLTTVKHALSVSLYEGIIFLSYFKEKRIKKCQRKDVEESVDKIIANKEDLDTLYAALQEHHPDLYANTPQEAFEAKKAEIEGRLA